MTFCFHIQSPQHFEISTAIVKHAFRRTMPDESQRHFIKRWEIRRLIDQAKLQSRSFEDLYFEMYPDDTSSTSDTDDCRPLDSLSIPSLSVSVAGPVFDSAAQSERLAALASLKAGQPSSDASEDEDNTYVRDLEAQALRQYNRFVKLEAVEFWNDELHKVRHHEELADMKYNEKVARKCLGAMRDVFHTTEDLERRRRLKLFMAWKKRKLAISAIHSWIVRHRENAVKKKVDDSQDIRAVTVAVGKWHQKAIESQERKHKLRCFFLASKFGRRWLTIVQERRISRDMAVLEQKYHAYRRERDGRVLRKVVSGWRLRAADTAPLEATADDRFAQSTAQRSRSTAHNALTSMYMATAESMSMEATADERYDKSLMSRTLSSRGHWRTRTRITREREEVADECRTIKDQAKAQRAFRNMRKTTAWGKQMNDEADAYHTRTNNAIGRRAIQTWRTTAASRRGEVVPREPPATPAARMSALRQHQQSQRVSP